MKHRIKKASITIAILAAFAVGITGGYVWGYLGGQDFARTTQQTVNPPTRAELLKLVNAERAKYGVAPLKEDPRLDVSAQAKADDEVAHGFGHECPKCLNGMLESEKKLGLQGNYSENLTENIYQNTAQAAVKAWIASTPHHKAMIDRRYTLTGFGISGKQIVEEFYSPQQFTTSTTKNFN